MERISEFVRDYGQEGILPPVRGLGLGPRLPLTGDDTYAFGPDPFARVVNAKLCGRPIIRRRHCVSEHVF